MYRAIYMFDSVGDLNLNTSNLNVFNYLKYYISVMCSYAVIIN